MLLVCLDDGRLSGGAPLSQNILSAENQKLTDTGGKFPHGEGALTLDQILNAVGIPAHRTPSTRFQAIRSIGLAAVRTGTNDLCPAVPCDGVKARRTVLYHGV